MIRTHLLAVKGKYLLFYLHTVKVTVRVLQYSNDFCLLTLS